MTITERMKIAKEISCLTVSDMALWFTTSRAAMCSWIACVNHHEPQKETAKLLEPLLVLLEKTLKKPSTRHMLPVPLHIRRQKRKAYILEVKAYATYRFSSAGITSSGQEVCGTDNQE